MTETTAPATEGCAICGYELAENGRHSGLDHEFVTVTEYLHRVPGAYDGLTRIVSTSMTDSMPDSGRNEYAQDRLKKAAAIMRLVHSAWEQRSEPADIIENQEAAEISMLARILDGTLTEPSEYAPYEVAALEIMNIPRIEASRSRAREAAR